MRLTAFVVAAALVGSACSDPGHTSAAFCDELTEVIGPSGIEAALAPGDPARIEGVVIELSQLHDRAPEEISTTTRTLLNFFRTYQRSPRDERRQVLADHEKALIDASAELDDYALNECGLFLQRAVPTPRPTSGVPIEVAPD